MALEHTGDAHFYRCTECGGTFDLKHNDHECETRDDAIARADAYAEALRAILELADDAREHRFAFADEALITIARVARDATGGGRLTAENRDCGELPRRMACALCGDRVAP